MQESGWGAQLVDDCNSPGQVLEGLEQSGSCGDESGGQTQDFGELKEMGFV